MKTPIQSFKDLKIQRFIFLIFLIFQFFNVDSIAQLNNHIFVNRGETTILRWQAPKDYSAYDSLYFAVKACTTNCGRLSTVSKSTTISYAEPYTSIACTLYADNTAGLNAAKYYYSIYAYGPDTLLVTNGNLNLQLNGQTVVDGVATVSPIYTITLSPPDHDTTFIIGYKADSTWDELSAATVRTIIGSSGGGGTNLEPELVVTPAESKIVMDVDSVGIRGDLNVDGAIKTYDFTEGGFGGDNILQFISDDSLYSVVKLENFAPLYDYQTIIRQNSQEIYLQSQSGSGGFFLDAGIQILGTTRKRIVLQADSTNIIGNLIILGYVTLNDYTFPPVDGSAGTVMKTDGDGNLYWGSDIYGGGGGSGSDTASVLYHLSKYVTADSFATYAEGIARYQPLESTLTDIADGTIVENLVNTTNQWADNEVANDLTVDATNISSSITRDTEVTKELLGTNGDISDGTITNGDDNTLPTEDDVYDFVIGQGYSNVTDSNFVLTSETSAWDKNSSNDLITTDTTAVTGKIQTKYQSRLYITDGNTNWNNSYGFITGNQSITLSGGVSGTGTTTIATTLVDSVVFTSEVSGDTLLGTAETLDSIITDYWNDDLGGGITNIVEDTTPELGGDLEIGGNNLINTKTSPGYNIDKNELNYLDGVTSDIQIQFNALQDSLDVLESKFQSLLDAVAECCDISDNTPPDAVTNLVAIPKSTTKDSVTWIATGSADANWYRIYRKTTTRDSTTATKIDSVAYGINYFVNTGLTENTVYWYWIKVVDDSGNVSGWCVGDSAKTFAPPGPTPLFTLDFEASSGWTGDGTVGSRSTTVAHGGTYSWAVTGSGGGTSGAYKTLTQADEYWATFYIYFPSTTTSAEGYCYVSYFDYGTTGSSGDRTMFAGHSGGAAAWNEWVLGVNAGNMTILSSTNFTTNAWRKVKMHYKKGTGANGLQDISIDNGSGTYTKLLDVTTGTYTDQIQSFVIGNQATALTGNIYIDDVKIYDTDPTTY